VKDGHVTIYDVAAKAGVHASTASRALSGLSVRKANRLAVEQAAAELGYLPNEAARSLRVVRTMTVGMVFNQLTSALGVELLGSVSAALDKAGYSLFVSTALGNPERYDQLLRRFIERRVDALLCVHGRGPAPALERYKSAKIPALALISKGDAFEALPLVSPSIEVAAGACVTELAALGHQRFAVVGLGRPINLIDDFVSAAGDRAAVLVARRHESGAIDTDDLFAKVEAFSPRPTVIVALLADAIAILDTAERTGRAVPADFSLVAIRDRSVQTQPTRIPLSLIHVDPTAAGARAAEVILAWLEDKTPLEADLKVPGGSWLPRASIGPASR
jgi:DNA-binding LacI/PurR family transcriptional regulator